MASTRCLSCSSARKRGREGHAMAASALGRGRGKTACRRRITKQRGKRHERTADTAADTNHAAKLTQLKKRGCFFLFSLRGKNGGRKINVLLLFFFFFLPLPRNVGFPSPALPCGLLRCGCSFPWTPRYHNRLGAREGVRLRQRSLEWRGTAPSPQTSKARTFFRPLLRMRTT